MAGKNRTASGSLAEGLRRLGDTPHAFGFYSALRMLENYYSDMPRIGHAALPRDESIRLGQEPSLSFANSTLAEFESRGKELHYLSTYFFGLFGPQGALPTHLTEYAHERQNNESDRTFRAFADVFHHRMLSFFYRAWAQAQPTVSLDRNDDRNFDVYAGALFGVSSDTLRQRDSLNDNTKRFWAGRLGQSCKPAEGLTPILKGFFGIPFSIEQFVGDWLKVDSVDRLHIGGSQPSESLGFGTILGQHVWCCQHRFRLSCGPLTFSQFHWFLPDQEGLAKLRDIVRTYVGDEFDWDCELRLKAEEVPNCQLGSNAALGWSTWIGQRQTSADATDVKVSAKTIKTAVEARQPQE